MDNDNEEELSLNRLTLLLFTPSPHAVELIILQLRRLVARKIDYLGKDAWKLQNFVLHNPTQVYFGEGQVDMTAKKLAEFGRRVLLVYGGGSIKNTKLYDQLLALMEGEGLNVWELSGVEPNPRLSTVQRGIQICREHGVEVILAVGGGSVIDASKAIALGMYYEGDVWDFYTQPLKASKTLPLGVIVTHAATGSEMNGRSVITKWETGEKKSTNQALGYPNVSILDPTLTYTVPKEQLIYGIVDIISHIYEQYITPTKNTPLQDRMCEAVLTTMIEIAPQILEQPTNYHARANMMLCATFALNDLVSLGMVQDWASHRIQYEVAGIYDIPHGGGLAIILPHWMDHVRDEALDKFVQVALNVWKINPNDKSKEQIAQAGIEALKAFFKTLGAPVSLTEYGVDPSYIPEMARKAVKRGPIGGIKALEEEDVRIIFERSF